MLEKTIVKKIRSELKKRRIYTIKIHGSGYQKIGLPDVWCCVLGQLICFEVKVEGNEPTKIQLHEIKLLRAAGALVYVVNSADEALEKIDCFLKERQS